MSKLEYTVRFLTPAFLGNNEQQGQWRTPPFKALLRHWWRIVEAPSAGYDWKTLRQREGELLGHAWLENGHGKTWAMRSRVQLRLTPWAAGHLTPDKWPEPGQFGMVTTTVDERRRVPADQYLGYGPVNNQRQLAKPAIGAGETARLTVLCRGEDTTTTALSDVLRLIHWFGALGSRARNGWGSLALDDGAASWPAVPDTGGDLLERVSLPWRDCMAREWPHALGTGNDGRLLIWLTEPLPHWRAVIGRLAIIKVKVRRAAKAHRAGPGGLGGPHLLGYPAGGDWTLRAWGSQGRLASQLRFKVLADGDGARGVVFHVPCALPGKLRDRLDAPDLRWLDENQTKVWSAIHDHLDRMDGLRRLGD